MKEFTLEMQSKYSRVPFKEHGNTLSGCDCGGLVWLIYKNELGIVLPDWRKYYSSTQIENSDELSGTISTMLGENGVEVPLSQVQPFDVLSFRIGTAPIHVGIAVNARLFLHIMAGRTCVAQERLDSPQWKNRCTGCFRHERMFSE